MNLNGKTVVITGGASGIGYATCKTFMEAGAEVILADINEVAGAKAASELGKNVRFMPLDVSSEASVNSLASSLDKLDVLVNAAGWDIIAPFTENGADFWHKVVAINFLGPVYLTRAFMPLLINSGSGRIVNIASDAGRVGSSGEAVYSGAKGGVIAFTKAMARELVRKNVRVNCVCPGPTDTPLFHTMGDKLKDAIISAIPMKRIAKPSEIADAILYFASDKSSYCTGQVLSVSGGLTMVD